MVPFWPHTEPGSAPIPVSEYLEATLVQRMLFTALMAVAQVSPNVFCSQGGFSQCTSEHYIICRLHHYKKKLFVGYTHILIYVTWHTAYILSTSQSFTAFTLSSFYISSDLLGRLAALDSWCPIQFCWVWLMIFWIRLGKGKPPTHPWVGGILLSVAGNIQGKARSRQASNSALGRWRLVQCTGDILG